MPRRANLQPTKCKVIQIRVEEDTFTQFENICYEKYQKSKSEVGFMLIKKFLEFNNGKPRK